MPGHSTRKFVRIPSNLIVKIRNRAMTEETRHDLDLIKNISKGGVFIETTMPFQLGSVVEMEFRMPENNQMVRAKGIVRWRNDGSIQGQPVGMGVEFYTLSAIDKKAISEFVRLETARSLADKLFGDDKRKKILQLHARNLGGSLHIKDFFEQTSLQKEDYNIIQDYVGMGLIKIDDDGTFHFTAPEDRAIQEAILKALKEG